MIELISSIIEKFGGRIAGSEEERNAQLYFMSLLEPLCNETEFHEFESEIKSKFHSLKIFCIGFVVALILFKINVVLATLIALFNSILFIGHFLLTKNWLDFLYKKHSSCNVIGTIEPKQKATSTILVSGHMDSVYEFQWWHKLQKKGALLTGLSGILIATQPIFYIISLGLFFGLGKVPFLFQLIWILQLMLCPALITFYKMHGKLKVDGAIDNLTGIALAFEMGKYFSSDNKLEHTRLKIVSFGSEETGLRGSRNYVKTHLEELKRNNTSVINTDTIRNKERLTILEREINAQIVYDEAVTNKMEKAFKDKGVSYQKIKLAIGATDGAAFANEDIPTTSIIGMSAKEFEPTYHTREDKLENLDPEGIETLREIMIHFIKEWDNDIVNN